MKNIVVAGGGILGSQIAFQAAYCGFNVTIWLRSSGSLERTKPKIEELKKTYTLVTESMDSNWAYGIADRESFNKEGCIDRIQKAYNNIKFELDMKKAVEDADLVIESIAEDIKEKMAFYKTLSEYIPEKTIIVTNSSTILPSKLAKYTGRPDKFLSLHFANSIWKNNAAEIMRQPDTKDEYFNEIMKFAEEIRMIPIPINKEKAGYLLNSMLIPLLFSAMDLYVNGISDPQSIDKAWTIGTGAPKGPFTILDTVGITTAYNIVKQYASTPSFLTPYNFKGMKKMLEKMLEEGKTGISAGEGFYVYK